ncbi:MAG: FtsH protease activity modulator HflK [Planctomycetota bacterium]
MTDPNWGSFEKSLRRKTSEMDPAQIRRLVLLGAVALVLIVGGWTSFYTVQPEEEVVVKRFGEVVSIQGPGLHFKLPFGVDRAYPVATQRVFKEEFGFRTVNPDEASQYRKVAADREVSLMLTGDLKVIDVEWVVQYQIEDADKYLHRARDPEQTLRDTSEAVMRRIVGNRLGSDVLTEKRVEVATRARVEIQEILDSFDLGLRIGTVELQDVTPPERVKPAFNEVNQAEQERERLINEAEKRRNQVIPRAEGEAFQVVAEAEGYAAERTNGARGEAERFAAILAEYINMPDVTRRRLYLEMIDKVLPRLGRIYIMDGAERAALPLLNLNEGSLPARGGNR